MHITNITQTGSKKGVITLVEEIPSNHNLPEEELIFNIHRQASSFVEKRFAGSFTGLDVRSLPTTDNEEGLEYFPITVLVDVDENFEGSLQDAAESLGMELEKNH